MITVNVTEVTKEVQNGAVPPGPRRTEVLESIDDAVLVFDRDHKVVYANMAAETAFNEPLAQLTGKSVAHLIPEGKEGHFDEIVTSLSKTDAHSVELRGEKEFVGKRSGGHTFYAEGKLAKLKDDLAFTLILRDITWRKQIEGELESALVNLRKVGGKIEYRVEHPRILEEFPPD